MVDVRRRDQEPKAIAPAPHCSKRARQSRPATCPDSLPLARNADLQSKTSMVQLTPEQRGVYADKAHIIQRQTCGLEPVSKPSTAATPTTTRAMPKSLSKPPLKGRRCRCPACGKPCASPEALRIHKAEHCRGQATKPPSPSQQLPHSPASLPTPTSPPNLLALAERLPEPHTAKPGAVPPGTLPPGRTVDNVPVIHSDMELPVQVLAGGPADRHPSHSHIDCNPTTVLDVPAAAALHHLAVYSSEDEAAVHPAHPAPTHYRHTPVASASQPAIPLMPQPLCIQRTPQNPVPLPPLPVLESSPSLLSSDPRSENVPQSFHADSIQQHQLQHLQLQTGPPHPQLLMQTPCHLSAPGSLPMDSPRQPYDSATKAPSPSLHQLQPRVQPYLPGQAQQGKPQLYLQPHPQAHSQHSPKSQPQLQATQLHVLQDLLSHTQVLASQPLPVHGMQAPDMAAPAAPAGRCAGPGSTVALAQLVPGF
eukprot:gene3333-633_t